MQKFDLENQFNKIRLRYGYGRYICFGKEKVPEAIT